MRISILPLLLLPWLLPAQDVRTDTLHRPDGSVEWIKHWSRLNVDSLSRAELFMRGLSPEDRNLFELDSLTVYGPDGRRRELTDSLRRQYLPGNTCPPRRFPDGH